MAMLFEWRTAKSSESRDSFPFSTGIALASSLNFSSATFATTAQRIHKRVRPQADVDGEGSGNSQKKKRRLRLNLITSRLSRPFATPTTHIIGRGTSKFAIWARRRTIGRDLLRKAAIMNRIRIRNTAISSNDGGQSKKPELAPPYQEKYDTDLERVKERGSCQEMVVTLRPSNQHIPQSPSPLGISNYDEFDEESSMFDDQEWEDLDNESANDESVNSDFNRREPVNTAHEEDDLLLSSEYTATQPLPRMPSSAEILEVVNLEDLQEEVSLAQFDGW